MTQQQEAFGMRPLVAELDLIKTARTVDVWIWMGKGWTDFKATWAVSGTYAACFTLVGLFISFGFYFLEMPYLILPGLSGFLLVGPALGVGFYEVSRRHHAGEKVKLRHAFLGFRRNPLGIFGLGMGLVFLFQVWIRVSFTIAAISFPGVSPEWADIIMRAFTTWQGIHFAIFIGFIGFFFAAAVFITCAFAMPMMVDRKTVLVPAMLTSAVAVTRNPSAMILWVALIVSFSIIGLMSLTIGLIVTFPLIGHATWHAYKQIIGEGIPISEDQGTGI